MVTVKKSFLSVLLLLFLSFLFSGCSKTNPLKGASEVDLNSKLPVQLEYRQFIYNCEISYTAGVLQIDFCNNKSFPDGFSYTCDSEHCTFSYEGIVKEYSRSELPADFMPVVLYDFFSGLGEVIVTEAYDSTKECSYIKRTVNASFVTLEAYKRGEATAYNIVVN